MAVQTTLYSHYLRANNKHGTCTLRHQKKNHTSLPKHILISLKLTVNSPKFIAGPVHFVNSAWNEFNYLTQLKQFFKFLHEDFCSTNWITNSPQHRWDTFQQIS